MNLSNVDKSKIFFLIIKIKIPMEIPIHEYVICTVNIPQIQRIIEKFSFPQQFSLDFIKTGYFLNWSQTEVEIMIHLQTYSSVEFKIHRIEISFLFKFSKISFPHINNFKKLINIPYDVFANLKIICNYLHTFHFILIFSFFLRM